MPKKTKPPRAVNSPAIVRSHFIQYLKSQFHHNIDWVHPVSNIPYGYSEIKEKLKLYKDIDPEGYNSLWYLWTSRCKRSEVAEYTNFSQATVKRHWDRSIDIVLLMLIHSELIPANYFISFCSSF